MTLSDILESAAVALCVMVLTMLLSVPMVAFYAWFIEPGQPQSFYTAAAQWIAPWSSHIFGPLAFFGLNYRLSRRRPGRHAMRFAAATIIWYLVLDAGSLPLFGLPITTFFAVPVLLSLLVKAAGAVLGARLANQRASRAAPSAQAA
jgi:hypothetical protein